MGAGLWLQAGRMISSGLVEQMVHRPLGKLRLAHQSPSNSFFLRYSVPHATAVHCAHSIHVRMSPGIGHVRCETQYRLLAVQEFPIQVDLQHAPAPFDRFVLAMVRAGSTPVLLSIGSLRPLH